MGALRGVIDGACQIPFIDCAWICDGFAKHDDHATERSRNDETIPGSEAEAMGACGGVGNDPSVCAIGGGKGTRACDLSRSTRAIDRQCSIPSFLHSLDNRLKPLPSSFRTRAPHRKHPKPTHGPGQTLTIWGMTDQGNGSAAPTMGKEKEQLPVPKGENTWLAGIVEERMLKDAKANREQPSSRDQTQCEADEHREHALMP